MLLVDIENLPYCLSTKAADEIFEKIEKDEYLSKIEYFTNLQESKEQWCAAFRKDSFSLRTRTSQRVERINRSIKTKVSSKTSLNELFLRIISLHDEVTNHDLDEEELLQIKSAHNLFPKCPLLELIDGKVSPYAFKFIVLHLAKSLTWKTHNFSGHFLVYQDQKDDGIKVSKISNNLLACSCYFYKNMLIPYEHMIACLVHSQDSEANRKNIANLSNFFHERWKSSNTIDDEDLINFIKAYKYADSQESNMQDNSQTEKLETNQNNTDDSEENLELLEKNENKNKENLLENLHFSNYEKNREFDRTIQSIEAKASRDFQPTATESFNLPKNVQSHLKDENSPELLNPDEVKKPGRPLLVKRYPSFYQSRNPSYKRKAEEPLPSEFLKKPALFL